MKKLLIAAGTVFLVLAVLITTGMVKPKENEAPVTGDSWAIYWYMCGSNLESFYGCATADLEEAAAVRLPENIKIVVETGGSYQWMNDKVSAGVIQRHELTSKGLEKIEELPDADMGKAETLSSFLSFCKENYPADHTMVIFWNHGGGSVSGAAFDEVYRYDSLSLEEFAKAFGEVYPEKGRPFDIIGFDACLMGTVDVACIFDEYGDYLVASEELEPGCGWYYTSWLTALAENSSMDTGTLGSLICDAYAEGCEAQGSDQEITLSVTDLSKLEKLKIAYNDLGNAALIAAIENPDFLAALGRQAVRSENYGGNTREQGFSNMVDLGHLARNCADILPEASASVLDALSECVVYKISGPYRSEATGLSCYYSYNGDLQDFADYSVAGASEGFKYLYAYGLTGRVNKAGLNYLDGLGYKYMDPEATARADEGIFSAYFDYRGRAGGTRAVLAGLDDPSVYAGAEAVGPAVGHDEDEDYDGGGDDEGGDDEYWAEQERYWKEEYARRAAEKAAKEQAAQGSEGTDAQDNTGTTGEGSDATDNTQTPGEGGNTQSGQSDSSGESGQSSGSDSTQTQTDTQSGSSSGGVGTTTPSGGSTTKPKTGGSTTKPKTGGSTAKPTTGGSAADTKTGSGSAPDSGSNTESEDEISETVEDEIRLLPSVRSFADMNVSALVRSYLSDQGCIAMEIPADVNSALRQVKVHVRQIVIGDEATGRLDLIEWGESDLINTDWNTGNVFSWFSGCWTAIDGVAMFTELDYSSEDYSIYSVPVLLNGELCNLHIVQDRMVSSTKPGSTTTEFKNRLVGARKAIDPETGMADKYLVQVKPGDSIVPVYRVWQDITQDGEWQYFYDKSNEIIYSEDTDVDMLADFGDGVYQVQFELIDSRGSSAMSDSFFVQVYGDMMEAQLWDEYMQGLDTAKSRSRY